MRVHTSATALALVMRNSAGNAVVGVEVWRRWPGAKSITAAVKM